MNIKTLLIIDALINFGLGILLVIFPASVARWLGLPVPPMPLYANILGAVLIGIALALLWEARAINSFQGAGLGVVGSAVINLCGGAMLAYWLVTQQLALTIPGLLLLWLLVLLLVGISTLEILRHVRSVQL